MDSTTIKGAKYLWRVPSGEVASALDIASSFNLSFPIAHTLMARGFGSREQIEQFLFSSFERDVAHPSLLKDADKAVDRIIKAINQKERILVFGDYDVDGITSSSLMMLCLLPLGAQVNFFLPHRVKDGYGLSTKVVKRAAENNYTLIVTVDNGITAIEPVVEANKCGIDVIITDHHRPHEQVPDAYAIVNPAQSDCAYPYKKLAGVGVIFKVLSLLYERLGKQLPPKAYELLLLGTVADVVPLTGENRFWVRHGLNIVNKFESHSLRVLKSNGKIVKPAIGSTDVGFGIAPQINALGRLEDPRRGVKFLIGSDVAEVERVGTVLFELNQARKTIERSIFEQVVAQIDSGNINIEQENIILAASNNWPPGVIGLVASRLVSTYGKPTLLFHLTKDGLAKGSCRSIDGFNIFDALAEGRDIIESFGGHSQAAGLSVKVDRLPELKDHLEKIVAQKLTPDDLQLKLALDAPITLSEVNHKLMADMQHLEPFGHENKQPIFYARNVVLVEKPQLLKDLHVKCKVFADGVIKPMILFNRPELFDLLMAQEQEPFDVAVQVVENHWNGHVNIELIGYDIAFNKE